MARHAQHQLRVKNGGIRHQRLRHQRVFTAVLRVGNDRVRGHFRAGTAGGGNGDQLDGLLLIMVFQRDLDAFGRIQRRTAAQRNNHIRPEGFKLRRALLQNVGTRIRPDLAVHRYRRLRHVFRQVRGLAGRHHKLIRDDRDFLIIQAV
ncbi:hypothetical protein D3C80_1705180 [compost metagenome]